jgi:hypothetical protein
MEVVPEEDTGTGDLSLLDLHHDSATLGQTRQFGRLREIDIEDKIKKRESFRSSRSRSRSRIIVGQYARCHRHLQAVDITGSTLDGKSNLFLYIYR